jgi:hypothetical protein
VLEEIMTLVFVKIIREFFLASVLFLFGDLLENNYELICVSTPMIKYGMNDAGFVPNFLSNRNYL